MLDDAFRKCIQAGLEADGSTDPSAHSTPGRLGEAIEMAGFLDLLVAPQDGGAGLDLSALYGIARICGELLVPLPVAETILARGWASANGFGSLDGAWIAFGGETHAVPHAAYSTHILDAECGELRLRRILDPGTDRWRTGSGTRLRLHDPQPIGPTGGLPIETAGAGLCAAWIAGGLHAIASMSLAHATGRVQFGRPLSRFQAVQQMMAQLIEEVAAAEAASRQLFRGSRFEARLVAIAKVRTGEAAELVSAHAHQVHGALGMTEDYPLSRVTRHIAAWRQAWGGEGYWSRQLGVWLAGLTEGTIATRLIDNC